VPLVRDFFEDLDGRWGPPTGAKIPLRIIGSSALMLQTGYERGTKDSDVLETDAITTAVKARLFHLGGKGSELHQRHRLYVEVVGNGIPFGLPDVPHLLVQRPSGVPDDEDADRVVPP
jgi:hypothetical protein